MTKFKTVMFSLSLIAVTALILSSDEGAARAEGDGNPTIPNAYTKPVGGTVRKINQYDDQGGAQGPQTGAYTPGGRTPQGPVDNNAGSEGWYFDKETYTWKQKK